MLADYNVEGTGIWLADSVSLLTDSVNVCVRAGSLGGVLTVNGGSVVSALPQVGVQPDTDPSPCTFVINDLSAPVYLHLDTSPAGSNPQWVCFRAGLSGPIIAERVFVQQGSGGGGSTVSWTPDPGTP
jgi:hypothetical protein